MGYLSSVLYEDGQTKMTNIFALKMHRQIHHPTTQGAQTADVRVQPTQGP